MKRKLILSIALIGLISILSNCKKDGDKVTMLANPVAPSLSTVPDLTLTRNNGTNMLVFTGTPVKPGFEASANYFLEACASGNNFVESTTILTAVNLDKLEITVSDLNGMLLKKFPADAVSSIDFRIRAVLVVDAGTGALGTSSNPLEYSSEIKTAEVTLYGLPRLNLIDSGIDQKIESALGDGSYFGFVKLDPANPFTLLDPDANIVYGASGSNLVVDGAGIVPAAAGWHKLNANTNDLTYSLTPYMIGLIGSATPNGWDTPDQKMDYDSQTGTWYITIDLIDGEIKFRKDDGWSWNLGGTPDNLVQGGANLPVTAGNYTITLTIINDATGTCTIVKN
jgi:hypothetical protein